MTRRRQIVFANSADYARLTGGWVYNTRMMRELAALGWDIVLLDLPAGFPRPDAEAVPQSLAMLAALPDDALVAADQICFSPLAAVLAPEAKRLRLVMLFHHPIAMEAGLPELERQRFQELERQALTSCRLVVATSAATAATLATDYGVDPERLAVARPGFDRFAPPGYSENGTPRILSVGAVIPRKGYDLLIAALAGLRDRPWQADIVGDLERAPAHVAELRRAIAAAGLVGRVALRGGLAKDELDRCWAAASIYVSASRHEGYGMAVAEAIARGLPTVTTPAGAIGGWLAPDAALIVRDDTAEGVGAALGRLIADPALRIRLRSAALAQASRLPTWREGAEVVDLRLSAL